MCEQFIAVCSFGAKPSAGNGRLRIAFNRNQLVVLVKNQLAAAYAAIWANRARHLCSLGPRTKIAGLLRHGFNACSISACLDLFNDWPARKQFPEHFLSLPSQVVKGDWLSGLPRAGRAHELRKKTKTLPRITVITLMYTDQKGN